MEIISGGIPSSRRFFYPIRLGVLEMTPAVVKQYVAGISLLPNKTFDKLTTFPYSVAKVRQIEVRDGNYRLGLTMQTDELAQEIYLDGVLRKVLPCNNGGHSIVEPKGQLFLQADIVDFGRSTTTEHIFRLPLKELFFHLSYLY